MNNAYINGYLEGYVDRMRKKAELDPLSDNFIGVQETNSIDLPAGMGKVHSRYISPEINFWKALKLETMDPKPKKLTSGKGIEFEYKPGVTPYAALAAAGGLAGYGVDKGLLGGKGYMGAGVGAASLPAILFLLEKLKALRGGNIQTWTMQVSDADRSFQTRSPA